jgi:DNA primase catalytic subunit
MDEPTRGDPTQKPLIDSLEKYYKENQIDIAPISNIKFRHFRLRLSNGSFYKIRDKIHDAGDLQENLVEYTPLDVYYSTATWLNPHLIAGKLDRDILRNIFLGCDLSFDIDISTKIKNLPEAQAQTLALNDFCSSKGFRIRYIAFSGSKGFHVVCDDPWTESTEFEPRKREAIAVEKRKKIIQEVKEAGIAFDEKVTVDTRRIIRLPGTINSKTALKCTILTKRQLESDIEGILKSATCEGFTTLRIPQKGEMTAPSACKTSGSLGRLGVRPKPEQNLCFSRFYTNNIPETRLKIPVLEFEGWLPRNRLHQIVEKTQRQYGLGSIYLFGDGEKYWAVSLKASSQRRVEKILNFSGSLNLAQCRKYGCTYTRIGKSVDARGEVVHPAPEFLGVIEAPLIGQVSRTHREFFASLGISLSEEDCVLCGAGLDKLEVIHAIVE